MNCANHVQKSRVGILPYLRQATLHRMYPAGDGRYLL